MGLLKRLEKMSSILTITILTSVTVMFLALSLSVSKILIKVDEYVSMTGDDSLFEGLPLLRQRLWKRFGSY